MGRRRGGEREERRGEIRKHIKRLRGKEKRSKREIKDRF